MLKRDVVNFFGNNTAVARIVGVNRSAVSQWKTLVPERCAQRLADASNGALVYDPMVYDKHKQSKKDGLNNENQTVS